MYSIGCLQVIFVMLVLRMRLSKCLYYCDDDVGICLYTNQTLVKTWMEARENCLLNGSILLEIYDERYKKVVINAIHKFKLEKWYLMFGLEYVDNQFRWSSGKNVTLTFTKKDEFNGTCYSFLVVNGSQLSISPSCDNKPPNHIFVCLKVNNISTFMTTGYDGNDDNNSSEELESITPPLTTAETNSNMSTPKSIDDEQPNNATNNTGHQKPQTPSQQQQQTNRNVGIGVGVGVALSMFCIALIILAICYFKRRSKKKIKSRQIAKERNKKKIIENTKQTSSPSANVPNDSCLVYADIDFKDRISDSKKEVHSKEVHNDLENDSNYIEGEFGDGK